MTERRFNTTELADFPELDGIVYLTGASCELTRQADRWDLGLLVTPASSVHRQASSYTYFAADNGLYVESKAGRAFDPDRWLAWLRDLPLAGCLFAALPDVLEWHTAEDGSRFPVGNAAATLERSASYRDTVAELGFPVALVAQDGLEHLDDVPFAIDAIFLGGSDDYKLGAAAAGLVAEAKDAGLWVHMGRVNSLKRLRYAAAIGCDSADGTKIAFGPDVNAPKVLAWLDTLAGERQNREAVAA